jgi:hypothetical protein
MVAVNRKYVVFTVLIFAIEVLIAAFVHDKFVRPYVGDVLVVILIYCCIRSFFNAPVILVTGFVLLFAFTIEFLQYMNIVEVLGLEGSTVARTVIGTSFAWIDLLAYVGGSVIILIGEKYFGHGDVNF